MKILLPIIFQLILLISFTDVKGQSLSAKDTDLKELHHVWLIPQESVDGLIVIDSCLFFVSDFFTTLTLPLGKTFEWKIPAGTKLLIPAGKYSITNNSASILEFKLVSVDKCAQSSKEIDK